MTRERCDSRGLIPAAEDRRPAVVSYLPRWIIRFRPFEHVEDRHQQFPWRCKDRYLVVLLCFQPPVEPD